MIAEGVVATLYEPNMRPYIKDGKSQRQKEIGTVRTSPLGPPRGRRRPMAVGGERDNGGADVWSALFLGPSSSDTVTSHRSLRFNSFIKNVF